MISYKNYEMQKDEIELLRNILFDQLKIIEEISSFVFEISIQPDIIESPNLKFILKISLPNEYPDIIPIYELTDVSNYIASSKVKKLNDKIKEFAQENLGMPMIYQIYELVKDFANEQEEIMHNENKIAQEQEIKIKSYSEKVQIIDTCLIETKTFTPVTKENFEIWYKKFYAEENKGKEKKIEQEQRLSGREYFMKLKMSSTGDYKDENIGDPNTVEDANENKQPEDNLYFDADAFEENIDDIDFEGADICDDY